MASKLHIALAGEFSRELRSELQANSDYNIEHNAQFAPTLDALPDLLILSFVGDYQSSLNALNDLSADKRPLLLTVLPNEDSSLLRKAMHAGARDYLIQPVSSENLLAMTANLLHETESRQQGAPGKITAVFSSSSNADAAFISGNLAHLSAVQTERTTTLLDLDNQFSSLPMMFDLVPEHSLLEALEAAENLDEVAINAYMMTHSSGIRLLSTRSDEIALPGEISVTTTRQILTMIVRSSQHLFINLPRSIDPLTTQVMEDADHIIVTVQQSFSSLNYARGLLKILLQDLEIPQRKITVLLNRYQKKSKISEQDIKSTLEIDDVLLLPADGVQVMEAGQYNLLLLENAPQSHTTKALSTLMENLSGIRLNKPKGLVAKLLGRSGGQS